MNVEKFIKKIQESESYRQFEKEMTETSTTGMVAGYQTPKAFSPKSGEGKESFDEKTKENAEQFGFEIVPKQKRRHSISYETYVERGIKKPIGKNIQENSTTSGFAQMNIGEAFIEVDSEEDNEYHTPHSSMKSTVNQAGYKPVHGSVKKESTYKQVMKSLSEASYKEYKGDKTKTTSEKINHSIKELNQALLRVERAVGHALRLKTEMAVDQRTLWRSSHSRLTKIGERLNRIGKKINELGA